MKSMLLKKNKTSSDELFISLAESAGQPVHWYHQPSHGDTQQGELVDETVLHELLPLATTSQITLLIPTKNVLLKTVTFSGKYRHQNLAVLAWQLESFCPGDVEQLHLTVLKRQGTQFSVAAIDKNQLEQWLGWLRSAGLSASRALPDVLALPVPTAGWTAARFNDVWLMRQSVDQGFSADDEELGFILGRYPTLPAILSYSQRPENEPTWLQKNVQPIWPLLAQGAQKNSINLLHGDFTPPRTAKVRGNKLLVALAAVYLLTFVTEPTLSGYYAQQHAEQIQQKTQQLYLKNFPGATPPKQWIQGIAQQIHQLEKDITPPGLLSQLRAAMPILQSLTGVKTQAMEWQSETLALTFNLAEPELLARIPRQNANKLNITTHPMDQQHTLLTVKGANNNDKD
ncbi:putative general secretion pathway protein L [Yersinia enterocolitica]|uniref:type II secretion system protein GspL n=1 Tax=Yersinia enterocolitica TaxID=630 RepID=UPI000506BE75|nr:type II secretion system protein GspL [Yersinia enterocolitica]ELI8285009.1 type II secretion system protein GspL [Yersinia enterocolitica]KGA75522.1 type II secretion system (T2SS), L family protein [Yersinia enterocolitica]MCE3129934.1 type II secretion system protein GspL [Yersinia enterocolitica]PNM16116.1 type II secretion system protein GspL [Yersinia enterocolitica]PNM19916.1 type II secretion system protein GspL [Yersinia enterocolitica]